jgi:hypothetical protein
LRRPPFFLFFRALLRGGRKPARAQRYTIWLLSEAIHILVKMQPSKQVGGFYVRLLQVQRLATRLPSFTPSLCHFLPRDHRSGERIGYSVACNVSVDFFPVVIVVRKRCINLRERQMRQAGRDFFWNESQTLVLMVCTGVRGV